MSSSSSRRKRYKNCLVPGCKSTTIATPKKHFFHVPQRGDLRLQWFKASRRKPGSDSTIFYCCEDHFDLTNDVSNRMEHELTGCSLRLNQGVVPSVFDCLPSKNQCFSDLLKKPSKRGKNEIPDSCLMNDVEDSEETVSQDTTSIENTSIQTPLGFVFVLPNNPRCQFSLNEELITPDNPTDEFSSIEELIITPDLPIQPEFNLQNSSIEAEPDIPIKTEPDSPFKTEADLPIKIEPDSDSEVSEKDNDEISNGGYIEEEKEHVESNMEKFIERKPTGYIGVPKNQLHVIKFWAKELNIRMRDMYLTLKKIKMNEPFLQIGDVFQISEQHAEKIFIQTLPVLESFLKQLIFMPKKITKLSMPPAFRLNFVNVSSIIDCIEVDIERPSDPIQQATTWNECKKVNTLKYLVACSPDGCISFVSKGYGGSIPDKIIVESSGLLKKVPPGTQIMTDRDFTHIEPVLAKVWCQLVRPPRLEADLQPLKRVKEGKRMTSLRTHVENLTKQFKEYNMLKSHDCIKSSLVDHMDSIVNVCAGLINLKYGLIKI